MSLAIGDYLVSQRIAQGATTITMTVNNAAGTVAGIAKRLSPRLRDDPAARAQLDVEARVLRALGGRGAPRLLATGEDAGGPWLVMERLEWPTLAAATGSNEPARAAVVARVAGVVLGALATVHEATDGTGPLEVVHGDVSPDNLLVDVHAPGACWIDFGLASFHEAPARRSEAFRGTARYAAPEVARGEPATVASDLFSLGLTLLHAASGEAPRSGAPGPARLFAAGEEPVLDYAHRAARGVGRRLRDVLVALVAFDPKARPGSAREAWLVVEGAHGPR